jgi:serine/threonine-protein kinase RsbW
MKDPEARHPFDDADEIFRGEIPSRLDRRMGLVEEVLARLEAAGLKPDPFFDQLVLDEAITNAILHGNREDPARKVFVRAFRKGDRWGVEVRDEGEGFPWRARLAAAAEPDSMTGPSGRGLALIQASGAELYFLDGGRCVVIVRGGAPGQAARGGKSTGQAERPPRDQP